MNTRLDHATGLLNMVQILMLHTLIIAWFWFGNEVVSGFSLYLITLIFCAIHQRHASEWLHEGLRFNIHPNRLINDFVTQFLLGAIFGVKVSRMRAAHFRHHRAKEFFFGDDVDTVYAVIRTRKDLLVSLLRDIVGISAITSYAGVMFSERHKVVTAAEKTKTDLPFYLSVILFYGSLFALSILISSWALIVYIVALLSVYPVLSRLRLYGQHLEIMSDGSPRIEQSSVSRNIDGTLLDRIFISSRLMQYHREHHKYPGLPFRSLARIARSDYSNANVCVRSHWPIFVSLWRL